MFSSTIGNIYLFITQSNSSQAFSTILFPIFTVSPNCYNHGRLILITRLVQQSDENEQGNFKKRLAIFQKVVVKCYKNMEDRLQQILSLNKQIAIEIQIYQLTMSKSNPSKGNAMDEIKKIEQKREERRKKMEEQKIIKEEKKAYNLQSGKNVDIDFEIMIQKSRFRQKILSPHVNGTDVKLSVCVRKRPIFKKEEQNGQIDSVSCANPQIKIIQPKYRVDGITKYVQNHTFTFDNTFSEQEGTEDIYKVSLKPLIPLLINHGIVTCFAYGQTGSGKTFTMNQLQDLVVNQMFQQINKKFTVTVSFFEIYGTKCLDLLNEKQALDILEDKSNTIQIQGLTQKVAGDAKELLSIMSAANSARTTHATVANDTSSRSHAICQIIVKKGNEDMGKLILVDLAGSERAQDTQSNNRQRRMEGAQINKSLLALKQCIRAMDDKADHVPFRASKLTLILRDSFQAKGDNSKIVMIACISPGSSSADHSLNTLRYADRLKDNSELNDMYNKMVEQNNKKNDGDDRNADFSKQHIQKINSAKNIKKEESASKPVPQNQNQKQTIAPMPPNKVPPKNTYNTKQQEPKKQQPKKQQPKKQDPKKPVRSTSVKKTVNTSASSNQKTNNDSSKKQNQIAEQLEIEEELTGKKEDKKKKVKDDVSLMKKTMKDENKEEYFKFQQKITNLLEEQEQVFATHMAAIKQDAKLLTQESELISKVQGDGYVDYDIDSYVEKLEALIKKKMKIYNLLGKKVESFKKVLKEEDEIRLKVKDTFYY